MNRRTKRPPGGEWYLPAAEVFWSRKPLRPKPAPLPKDIPKLYSLISRYWEARQLVKDAHCNFRQHCGAFHDLLVARGLKPAVFDHFTPAQLEHFQEQAWMLLLKYLPWHE